MTLTLHYHPLSSFCHKVLIALYENGVPFEKHLLNLGDETERARFKALWPAGKMPVLSDEARAQTVPETTVIIDYLDRQYPGAHPLLPKDEDEAMQTRLWDRLFDLYVHLPMQKIVGDRLRPEGVRDAHGVAEASATMQMAYDMIEKHMTNRTWAGARDFSLADCAAAPALFYGSFTTPFSKTDRPKLSAYFERLLARPSVARTISEAKPFFQYFPLAERIPARFK
jgi:glutathione S-transferase